MTAPSLPSGGTTRIQRTCASFLAVFLGALGCDREPGDSVRRAGQPTVEMVAEDDSAMEAAMETARATLDQVVQRIQHPPARQTHLSLKVRLEEGAVVEHIWLTGLGYARERFQGRIDNEPLDLRRVRLGDTVSVTREQVSDWMAVDDGRLAGGYTLRVLRDRMSPAERAELDRSMGVRVE